MRALHVIWGALLVMATPVPGTMANPAPARAEAAPDARDARDAKAAEHYRKGMEALKVGRLEEARAELLSAWRLKAHYQIAANLGAVELRLGQPVEASEHLAYFLREARGAGVAETEIRQGERMLAEALQRAEAEAATASAVQAKAAGADAAAGTGAGAGAGAEVNADANSSAAADAMEAVEAAVQRRAQMVSRAADGARATPAERVEVGVAVRVRSGPEEVSRPVYWPGLAAAGLAVAGIGVGIGATFTANARDREADEALEEARLAAPQGQRVCPGGPGCEEVNRLLEEEDRFADLAMAGYAVGGVAALGAAVLLIWPVQKSEQSLSVRVAPMSARQGGGLVVRGSF